MGKIYVMESGSDACGKATQTKLLYENLLKKNSRIMKVEFPNYKSPSSSLVKMYLNGDFGSKAEDINPYITSTFFAIDRYATFKKEIQWYYDNGYIIIADRYTTSNMVYQAGKYDSIEEKNKFLDWLYDFEFNLYGLPVPDKVFFLDLPFEISYNLMKKRSVENKRHNELLKRDIHENNKAYLKKVYKNAKFVSEKYGWINIDCSENDGLKSIENIHSMIMEKI
ncbi:dTMP kinase [Peptoanaerobacter stomatis]|uniref:Thymidylate kinase n=1 Tax=Peptoanaerobacter stomatis TaxID=796937 RepID=J4WDY8_9FIRM|nr:thymidylate kinase [Peptoanaerobacter stomatis]EJU23601.1 dTMP kinase [Peptoanaerobacter stomatis]NWO24226.1 thymidylate kinase [Peptostreptococcaceae bacterium oral taxon 081]